MLKHVWTMCDRNPLKDKISYFGLRFHKNSQTFFPGDEITGIVEIEANVDIITNGGVEVIFRAESLACWNEEDEESSSSENNKTVRCHRSFWTKTLCIFGNKDEKCDLMKGVHVFDFIVRLPAKDLPSSCESKFGAIRYWVKACLNVVDGTSLNCQQPFTVLQKINVNEKKYQISVYNSAERTVTWFCCGYGGLQLSAFLDRAAYCSGEAIAVNCRGNNVTNKQLGGIKARLVQIISYKSDDNKTKRIEAILCAIGGNHIPRGGTKIWENQLLWIPAIPPTNILSENIRVRYKVQVSMATPNNPDLQVDLPITIGTIPWNNNNKDSVTESTDVKLQKCTDGTECFNRSSKRYRFPMHPFIPSTSVALNYTFQPPSSSASFRSEKWKQRSSDEKQPLLQVT